MSDKFNALVDQPGLDEESKKKLSVIFEMSNSVVEKLSEFQVKDTGFDPFSGAMTVLALVTSFLIACEAKGREREAADMFDEHLRSLLEHRKKAAHTKSNSIH